MPGQIIASLPVPPMLLKCPQASGDIASGENFGPGDILVGVFHLPPGAHPASWRTRGIFPGGFSLLFQPQAAQGSGLQPASPPMAPHRRLRQKHHVYCPQPALQKETSRHDTATRKRASKAGGTPRSQCFPLGTGAALCPHHVPPSPAGCPLCPPCPQATGRGAAGAEGAKWDFFMGLGEYWKLDITRATMNPPPKYLPPPSTHTHTQRHQ